MVWENEAGVWEDFNTAVHGRLRLDLIHRRLAERGISPGDRVLDVGCGTGETSLLLAMMGARVTALDHSRQMLARAERRARAAGVSFSTIEADATDRDQLPIGPFDLIVCHNVLAYIPEGQDLVRAMAQRLSADGQLSVVVSNPIAEPIRYALEHRDLAEALRWARERPRVRQGRTFDHPMRFQDRSQLTEWIEGAGLRSESISGLNVIAPYLSNEFKEDHYEEVLALEVALGGQPAYAEIAVHLHAWATPGALSNSGTA